MAKTCSETTCSLSCTGKFDDNHSYIGYRTQERIWYRPHRPFRSREISKHYVQLATFKNKLSFLDK